jgi:hypothetical protein
MAKRDIAGTFKMVWVDLSDVELFASDVDWTPAGDPSMATEWSEGAKSCGITMSEWSSMRDELRKEGVTVIYLVLSFGFSGSPGEWTAWGAAAAQYHRAHRPSNAARDVY